MPFRPNTFESGAGTGPLEHLLTTLDVKVQSFAVCKVGRGARLLVEPKDAVLIHFVLSGEGVVEVTGRPPVRVGAQSVVVVPPRRRKTLAVDEQPAREVHADAAAGAIVGGLLTFEAGEPPTLLTACGAITATYAGGLGLFGDLGEPIVEDLSGIPALLPAFDMLLNEVRTPGLGSQALSQALMKQCLVLLLRQRLARPALDDTFIGALRDPRLLRAVSAIVTRPSEAHTLQSLAHEAGMSRSSFVRHFVEAFAQTPFGFLQQVRLRLAAQLLRGSDVPVKVIAASAGFSSRSHFSRSFKAAYGQDPSTYRMSRDAV